jgi:uncharacterized linocin/CFP29 family protein
MSDDRLPWSDAEWTRIRQIVRDEAIRTRVAAAFLPLYGPLPDAAETAPAHVISSRADESGRAAEMLEIDDYTMRRFASVSVNVHIKNHMIADPNLEAATALFRRAASLVARVEDHIIFNGKAGEVTLPGMAERIWTTGGDQNYAGLLDSAGAVIDGKGGDGKGGDGPQVFSSIVKAVLAIEDAGYHKPYAVVLAHDLFLALHEPMPGSMVLPRDSVPPITEGPLLRAAGLPAGEGLVISLQGDPVEIVVPADITVRYLQTALDGGHVFRVSQRFLLRVKDKRAVARITSGPKAGTVKG